MVCWLFWKNLERKHWLLYCHGASLTPHNQRVQESQGNPTLRNGALHVCTWEACHVWDSFPRVNHLVHLTVWTTGILICSAGWGPAENTDPGCSGLDVWGQACWAQFNKTQSVLLPMYWLWQLGEAGGPWPIPPAGTFCLRVCWLNLLIHLIWKEAFLPSKLEAELNSKDTRKVEFH